MPTSDALRYPIGPAPLLRGPLTPAERADYQQQLADLPAQLAAAAQRLGPESLAYPYRPGGWTGHQVIHHVADSHLNAYCRFRLALTEDNPTIKPYDEAAWAALPDVATEPVAVSLALLASLHQRWVALLDHLPSTDWQRTFYHPGNRQTTTLDQALATYAWHGRHHLAHLGLLAGA
ncbi:putative metal-dependent hydrolase [Hymenobacter sp. RP-2-7]|uniref:Putative metal-dependent hydrolase n=1 Tax=Hymenobacter polaris TaxID=2682546 RepID=A0A7Y0FLN7_9BACT|nr:putative metal-dependent hydrolase [Hymenobacter polaris]NML64993.1 putative metal-dependent hydrolase [Hymenobacter polaris]